MIWRLTWPILLLATIPLAVSYLYFGHLPAGFGIFPPLPPENPPPNFLWWYFGIMALVCLAVVALYLFPKAFGIQGATPAAPAARASFPVWGWVGAVVVLFCWYLMWASPSSGPLAPLVPFVFSPLWWGFIFVLDALVYSRNNGISLFSSKPKTLLIMAVVSLFGWLFFEYFDYFVNENWGYPNTEPGHSALPHKLTVAVYLIAYTTVWPAVFQWYNLLNTCPKLAARYKNGPQMKLGGMFMILAGFVGMAIMTVSPLYFFFLVWVGPTLVFCGVLQWLNIPNPLSSLAEGNWAPGLLIFLACFLNGFIWEFWNYGSANPENPVTNPNYWKYYIPFVNVLHFHSEMPLLGYFGYMPFGLLCWQLFIWSGRLFGFNPDINVTESGKL